MDDTKNLIIIHNGTSFNLFTDYYACPAINECDITWMNGNLASSYGSGLPQSGTIFIHSGSSSTISSTFASPYTTVSEHPNGLGFDGTNLITGTSTGAVSRVYKHSGITSTIQESFLGTTNDLWGVADTGGATSR